ncbi:MAG: hypothetical protein UY75_C0004G0002 [Parcubacteria group bacterium GW2011_GWC2_52_8c]|nr:MAG: hypothetical protein UY75_C0004G0002 [Parcubacteria group bacterium GW2011_GWC2_52_8c]
MARRISAPTQDDLEFWRGHPLDESYKAVAKAISRLSFSVAHVLLNDGSAVFNANVDAWKMRVCIGRFAYPVMLAAFCEYGQDAIISRRSFIAPRTVGDEALRFNHVNSAAELGGFFTRAVPQHFERWRDAYRASLRLDDASEARIGSTDF